MPAEHHQVLIGIKAYSGSDMKLLKQSLDHIRPKVEVTAISSIYKVKGKVLSPHSVHDIRSRESYIALVTAVRGLTCFRPELLKAHFQKVEEEMRSEIMHSSVSVDLFVFEGLTLMTPQITLPHPEFHQHAEHLIPAAEVWGDYEHPVLKQSVLDLTQGLADEKWGEFFAQGKALLEEVPGYIGNERS